MSKVLTLKWCKIHFSCHKLTKVCRYHLKLRHQSSCPWSRKLSQLTKNLWMSRTSTLSNKESQVKLKVENVRHHKSGLLSNLRVEVSHLRESSHKRRPNQSTSLQRKGLHHWILAITNWEFKRRERCCIVISMKFQVKFIWLRYQGTRKKCSSWCLKTLNNQPNLLLKLWAKKLRLSLWMTMIICLRIWSPLLA